jgi:uncharacterized heparinase superfamily protein
MQVAAGLRHRRELNHPAHGKWEITDRLVKVEDSSTGGEKPHDVKWFFHVAPDLTLESDATSEQLILVKDAAGSALVRIVLPAEVKVQIESSWYSASYGHKQPNQRLVATWRGPIPDEGLRFAWGFQRVQ